MSLSQTPALLIMTALFCKYPVGSMMTLHPSRYLLPVDNYYRWIFRLLPMDNYYRWIITTGGYLLPVDNYYRWIITTGG